MHSWKYMQTCGWALPLGYYPQVGALQFQRRAYRLKACALAEGWLKDQHQKALDGLASLEAVGWSRFNGGPGGQRFLWLFSGPKRAHEGLTFTGTWHNMDQKVPHLSTGLPCWSERHPTRTLDRSPTKCNGQLQNSWDQRRSWWRQLWSLGYLFGTYIYLDKMLYILIHIDSIDLCSVIFGWSVFFGLEHFYSNIFGYLSNLAHWS